MIKRFNRKALSIFLTLAIIVFLLGGFPLIAAAGGSTTLTINDFYNNEYTIDGSYDEYILDSSVQGDPSNQTVLTVYVETEDPVTITGSGIDSSDMHEQIKIVYNVYDADLTIKDLYICNNNDPSYNGDYGDSIIRFDDNTDNDLYFSGTSLLETMEYVDEAGIYIPDGSSLTIDKASSSSDTLYLYKYSQAAGIGGDAYGYASGTPANGDIEFAGGNVFIKGSKTGPLVGNDCYIGSVDVGDIRITGGNINFINKAQGAAIGGSRYSGAGDVYISGGNVTFFTDFSGSAVGAGAQAKGTAGNNGKLYITGGSVKAAIMDNAYSSWGSPSTTYERLIPKTGEEYVVSDAAMATALSNAYPTTEHSLVTFDTGDVPAASSYTVTIRHYGDPSDCYSYTGGLHKYQYSDCTYLNSLTTENWDEVVDPNLYFYLPELTTTGDKYVITVNDMTFDCVWNGSSFNTPVATNKVYLNGTFAGTSDGSYSNPYKTFESAKGGLNGNPGVIYVTGKVTVSDDEPWDLDTYTLARFSGDNVNGAYTGDLVEVTGETLTLTDITINGKSAYVTPSNSVGNLVEVSGSGSLALNSGAILQSGTNSAVIASSSGSVSMSSDSYIRGNGGYTLCTSLNGAGISQNAGSVTVSSGVTMKGNIAIVSGGAVYLNSGSFTMTGGTITSNSATNGGGIYADGGTLDVQEGSAVTDNTATTHGGGLYATEDVTFGEAFYDGCFFDNIAPDDDPNIYIQP